MTYSGKWTKPSTITKVEPPTEKGMHYGIGYVGGGFGFSREYGVVPKVGDTLELNLANFSEVRGVRINGQTIFHTSDEDAAEKQRKETEQFNQRQKQIATEEKAQNEAEIAALPPALQAWINRLRSKTENYWWESQPYDLFCAKEAHKLLQHFKTHEELSKFAALTHKEQVEAIGWSDEHSGHTFGQSVALARLMLTEPRYVKFFHSGMAAIISCKEVGCHPLTAEEEAELDAIRKEAADAEKTPEA
jgi:predicted NAD-dependent protein-ADP-ribosyltransferase YbiA (DUF1768 family)